MGNSCCAVELIRLQPSVSTSLPLVLQHSSKRVSAVLKPEFQSGDLVVYTMSKQSPQPGPRARSVHPAEFGDDYSYVVDKFWMVASVLDNDRVVLVTRRGKRRIARASDPLLKKANWWQRLRFRNRFPDISILKTVEPVQTPQEQLR